VKRTSFWPLVAVLTAAMVVLSTCEAMAVVPAVVGPIQALVAILPQLLAMMGAAIVALAKPETYKAMFKFLWHQKLLSLGIVVAATGIVWGAPKLFGGSVEAEKAGAPWMLMRGGPTRPGAVAGARGPKDAAKIMWNYAGKKRERVDSSPAVVGNRIYTSSAVLSLFGGETTGTGTIYCRDTDGGGVVWEYNGEGMEGGRLVSVFSSPAIAGEYAGEKNEDGSPKQGRYLVSGEGYHQDINSRFFCLDLKPTRDGKRPKLQWYKQATSHVESSPCVHKCPQDGKYRVYIGAGDDGLWCVDLEGEGKINWMVEGTPSYYVHAKCEGAEKVKALAGKQVKLKCTVKRFGATMTDPGQVLVMKVHDVQAVEKAADATTDVGKAYDRTIYGKVEVGEQPTVDDPEAAGRRIVLEEATGVRIRVPRYYLDVESAPAAADFPKDPAKPEAGVETLVFFGTGLGGEGGVGCVDGITGEHRWFYKVGDIPVFSPPTVVKGVKIRVTNDKGEAEEKVTDVLLVGYGEGDFVNVGSGPGYVLCLDIHAHKDGFPRKLWETEVGSTILGAVAAPGPAGPAIACSRDGKMYVLKLADGTVDRRIPLGASLVCSPSITADAVYAVSLSGTAYCVDRKSFDVRWKLPVAPCPDMFASPLISKGKMFVGSPGQGLFCLVDDPAGARKMVRPFLGPGGDPGRSGAADGIGLPTSEGEKLRRKWNYILRDRTAPGPVAGCGGWLYLNVKPAPKEGEEEPPADAPLMLAKVHPRTGEVKWEKDLGVPASTLAATGERVYVLAGKNGREQNLYCLDAADPKTRIWSKPAVYLAGALALNGNRVYVVRGGQLECLDTTNMGKEIWKRELGETCGAPAALEGVVLIALAGDVPKVVCMEDGDGRVLWESTLPAEPVGSVACAGGRVLVACKAPEKSEDPAVKGSLVCLRLTSGKRLWKGKLPAEPVGYPVLGESYAAITAADGKVYSFEAMPGKFPKPPGAPEPAPPVDPKLKGEARKAADAAREVAQKEIDEKHHQEMLKWESKVRQMRTEKIWEARPVREEGLPIMPDAEFPQPPAMIGSTLVLCAKNRLWTWSMATRLPAWTYYGERVMGRALAPPIVMDEAVYVVSDSRGVVAVGSNKVVELLTSAKTFKMRKSQAMKVALIFQTVEELRAAKLPELTKLLEGDAETAAAVFKEFGKKPKSKSNGTGDAGKKEASS
jgi:outer membrane protein assembly factor BamB